MIYLQNISDSQMAHIPRNGSTPSGDMQFRAKSTIDLDYKVDCEVLDLGTSHIYFNVALTLPSGMPNGEYEYTLCDDNGVLSTGLLIVGEHTSPEQMNNTTTYEQYRTDN